MVRPQAHSPCLLGRGSGPHCLTFGRDTGSRASRLSRSSNLLGCAVPCKETTAGMPLLCSGASTLQRLSWGQEFQTAQGLKSKPSKKDFRKTQISEPVAPGETKNSNLINPHAAASQN